MKKLELNKVLVARFVMQDVKLGCSGTGFCTDSGCNTNEPDCE